MPNVFVEEPYYEEAIPMYDPRELPMTRGFLFKKGTGVCIVSLRLSTAPAGGGGSSCRL